MASIVERTVSSETDKRLSLIYEQAGRTLSVGSDWVSIRIGMRWSVNTAAAPPFTIPSLYLGLSSGTASLPNDAATQHFLGVGISPSLTLNQQTGNVMYVSGLTTYLPRWLIVNGSATSDSTGTGAAASFVAARSSGGWVATFVEITKNSSTSFQVKGHRWYTATSCTTEYFNSIMADGGDSMSANLRVSCDHPVSIDEVANGSLDSVALSWGHLTVAMEISDLDFRILA